MNKNGITTVQKIFLAVAGLIVLLVLFTLLRPREPHFENRPLTSWLPEFETYGTDPDSPPAKAVKSMGTAAIPYLLDILSGQEPGMRRKIRDLAEKLSIPLSSGDKNYMRPVTAGYALNVLGPTAEPAFRALTNLFYEQNAVCSAIALAGIGPTGTQFLISETTGYDPRLRYSAVNALGDARSDYEEIVSLLTSILTTNKDPLMRSAAASGLGRLGRHPETAVPVLVASLSDQDSNVRGMSIISLGQFGPQAKRAISALTEALNDPDEVNVKLAIQALEKILPKDS